MYRVLFSNEHVLQDVETCIMFSKIYGWGKGRDTSFPTEHCLIRNNAREKI